MTASALSPKKVALGRNAERRGLMMDAGEQPGDDGIVPAAFDRYRSLPRRGKDFLDNIHV